PFLDRAKSPRRHAYETFGQRLTDGGGLVGNVHHPRRSALVHVRQSQGGAAGGSSPIFGAHALRICGCPTWMPSSSITAGRWSRSPTRPRTCSRCFVASAP